VDEITDAGRERHGRVLREERDEMMRTTTTRGRDNMSHRTNVCNRR